MTPEESFKQAFEKERDRQISEMDQMFADPLFRAMAERQGIDMAEMDKVHAKMKAKMKAKITSPKSEP